MTLKSIKSQEQSASKAFSAQSKKFDQITSTNPMEIIYRGIVRKHVMKFAQANQYMLELNCGTGLDAYFFAENGLRVLATDNSEGMLRELKYKLNLNPNNNLISFQRCSFNKLSSIISTEKFDHVFSNFGGLNCAPDMQVVVSQLDPLLRKNSMVHFVMISPFCPWEWMAAFKGRFEYAFRRLRQGGVRSHLEGYYFDTYYHSPFRLKRVFGKKYEVMELISLGCFMPPTYKEYFPSAHPMLFNLLKKAELRLNKTWPFNRFGDLYIISLLKKS